MFKPFKLRFSLLAFPHSLNGCIQPPLQDQNASDTERHGNATTDPTVVRGRLVSPKTKQDLLLQSKWLGNDATEE